jgi:hypothetical protein
MMKNLLCSTLIGLTFLLSCSSNSENGPNADLVLMNANIWTADSLNPQAQAMAIGGDTILAIGSNEMIETFIGADTKTIDAKGQFVTPGFIDSHVHLLTGGFRLSSVQLRDADSPETFARRIRDYAQTLPPSAWITGGDWDHENWGGQLPDKAWIDQYTPDNPVWVNRLDGHMALANSAALAAAGIDQSVQDISGGTIVRNTSGEPTGIFKDNAMDLVAGKIPDTPNELVDRALDTAMHYLASNGVTSVHHMVGYMDALERARDEKRMITRVYAMMGLSNWEALKNKIEQEGRGDKWLKIGGLKGFVDGSLGSHTAAFKEPYTDQPEDAGFFVNTTEDLYNWIALATQHDLQVMVHAIGDRAIRSLLDVYDEVDHQHGLNNARPRIEHSQHIDSADVPYFNRDIKVIASMQPYHAIDDGRWATKVIGQRRSKTTYAFRSLLDAGVTVAFGSDWFVAPPNVMEGIYAAVTRRTLDGANPDGWVPEQKISVEEALRAYTLDAAYASFDENIKGSLEKGKLADFVILSEDLSQIDPVKIREVDIKMTVVGGQIVFEQ